MDEASEIDKIKAKYASLEAKLERYEAKQTESDAMWIKLQEWAHTIQESVATLKLRVDDISTDGQNSQDVKKLKEYITNGLLPTINKATLKLNRLSPMVLDAYGVVGNLCGITAFECIKYNQSPMVKDKYKWVNLAQTILEYEQNRPSNTNTHYVMPQNIAQKDAEDRWAEKKRKESVFNNPDTNPMGWKRTFSINARGYTTPYVAKNGDGSATTSITTTTTTTLPAPLLEKPDQRINQFNLPLRMNVPSENSLPFSDSVTGSKRNYSSSFGFDFQSGSNKIGNFNNRPGEPAPNGNYNNSNSSIQEVNLEFRDNDDGSETPSTQPVPRDEDDSHDDRYMDYERNDGSQAVCE